MNRVTIRRFDVVRTATVAAVMYAVLVLVGTLLFFVPIALLAGAAARESGGAVFAGGVLGVLIFGALGALFYAVIGWIMTAIACALYNFVAGRVGGIRVEVDVEGPYPGGPGYGTPAYAVPAYQAPAQPSYGYPTPGYPPPGAPPTAPGGTHPAAPGGTPPPPPGWGQPGS